MVTTTSSFLTADQSTVQRMIRMRTDQQLFHVMREANSLWLAGTIEEAKSSSKDARLKFLQSPLTSIRHCSEIMLEIYSFLPLSDRVCNLALVDKRFASDKVRSGFRHGRYGPSHLNLTQALHAFRTWASLAVKVRKPDDTATKNDTSDVSEKLLNLVFGLSNPSRSAQENLAPTHWMEDLVALEDRYESSKFGNAMCNRLSVIIGETKYVELFKTYHHESIYNIWMPPPRLDPGLVLTLPHSDKGREIHFAAVCFDCGKLHSAQKALECHHGRMWHICKSCDRSGENGQQSHRQAPPDFLKRTDGCQPWGCNDCACETNSRTIQNIFRKRNVEPFRQDFKELVARVGEDNLRLWFNSFQFRNDMSQMSG